VTTLGSTWLPVPTAARRLGLSERRVWALVSEKRIGSTLVGGRRLVDPGAIAARAKKSAGTEVLQWQLQSESIYARLVRLERSMKFILEELKNGRR
jgi:hypothetical protein